MATLREIASRAQDQFYQDYPDRKAFFLKDTFKFHAAAKYSSILNTMYQVWRKDGKADTGFSNVEINAQWLIAESADKIGYDDISQRWYIDLKFPVFSFDFDAFGNGLNGLRGAPGSPCSLNKISNQEIQFYDLVPTTSNIYYYLEGKNRIFFVKKPTLPLTSYYIPEVLGADDNCVMSDNIVSDVIMATLQLMFGAKNGNVIPQADDGNRNAVLPQQVNPDLGKQGQG